MLHYFRLNDPYRFIGLLIIFLIIYIPFLIDPLSPTVPELKLQLLGQKVGDGYSLYTQVIDSTEPLTAWAHALADLVFGDSILARRILAFVIFFVETALLGIIFIDKKAFPESSFIPPLIFGILGAFSFDTLTLSGELMGIFFLLLALNSLFREIESREQLFDMVLKTGLFLGISTLFAFSFIVYVIATLAMLIIFTRSSGRKLLLLLTGFMIPHLLLIGVYTLHNGVDELWRYYYLPNLGFNKTTFASTTQVIYVIAIPLGFFFASLVVLNRESRFTKYQSQLLQAMFFWTIFSFVQVYYSNDFRPQSFLTVMVGLSFFIAHFFSIVLRRRFAELSFWIFLGGIVSISYLSRYEIINSNLYDGLILPPKTTGITGKKVLLLGNQLQEYEGNSVATPFLNWTLSEEIFTGPEYYQNITSVYHGFKNDMPEIILDPQDHMKPFLERIPELRKKYARIPEGYRLVSANN